jgi:putative transposase
VVIPGLPHHITQRGNGRQKTFFEDGDYALYLDLFVQAAERAQTQIWAYCLMPNHVHAIVVPGDEDGLRRTFGDLHRRYTGYVHARERKTGHLWQGRYGSVAMDEAHAMCAIRYVSLNPVRARLVDRAEDWRWSSVRAHRGLEVAPVIDRGPVLERTGNFAAFLGEEFDEALSYSALRKAESVGRPVGSADWLKEYGGADRDGARGWEAGPTAKWWRGDTR